MSQQHHSLIFWAAYHSAPWLHRRSFCFQLLRPTLLMDDELGINFLINQEGLARAAKKPRFSNPEEPVHTDLNKSQDLFVALSHRPNKRVLSPGQQHSSAEKRTRRSSAGRPALAELLAAEFNQSSPRSPPTALVPLDGPDRLSLEDARRSRDQINAALIAPDGSAPQPIDGDQLAEDHQPPPVNPPSPTPLQQRRQVNLVVDPLADPDTPSSTQFEPRTPQQTPKVHSSWDDKEWHRFFDVLRLNATTSPRTPSQVAKHPQPGGSHVPPRASPQRGSFFLGEFGRCSHVLRSRNEDPNSGN